jgi:hypothetical protein
MVNACTQTVSILYAIAFGAGEACVRIDLWSILSAFAAFIGIVMVAQFIMRRLWARITHPKQTYSDIQDPKVDRPIVDDPNYTNSAIRSAKR